MAAKAYHNPDNVEILDMHRGPKLPDSHTLFPNEGCCQPPPGAKLTVMLFYAKRAAKEEMKAKGIRVAYIQPREVRLRAEELLRERWEDFERLAQPVLLKSQDNPCANLSRTIGYARVSTDGQTLDAQLASLKAAGCTKVYSEKVSGAKTDRRQLANAIAGLAAGDVLLVTRLILTRGVHDLKT